MKLTQTKLPGVLLIEPKIFGDARGYFLETWNRDRYLAAGFPDVEFVQDNLSHSRRGILRGLHFQKQHPQGKLIQVIRGAVFDVVVDVRKGSPSFGQWDGVELSGENHRQLWIPPGFAGGHLTWDRGVETDALFAGMTLPQLVLVVISGLLMHVLAPLPAATSDNPEPTPPSLR